MIGTFRLPPAAQAAFDRTLADWRDTSKTARLWKSDPSLWTSTGEEHWLGWLHIAATQLRDPERFARVAAEVSGRGFRDILLLGMGGSSLCPEVLALSFGQIPGFPRLHILDSTDPAQVRAVESRIDLERTLFIVSSKSGSTLEPNIFKQYFFERAGRDGSRFFAITDPGSKMQEVATRDGFRQIFFGDPAIGGRYSALSDFGLIPAAAMGLDTDRFLANAEAMARACAASQPVDQNPGVLLGALLGTLGTMGRDKVTIIASPGIHDLGAWLEQLIAESTGKNGRGLIPVDREPLGPPEIYGSDRVFVYERLETAADSQQDRAVEALAAAGHPVVRIAVPDVYHLGAEFFRWEFATAVAGAVLGINPFDQPDVEASKIATRKLTTAFESTGSLPAETPALEESGIQVFGGGDIFAKGAATLVDCLRAHCNTLRAGDYFALLAYLEMNGAHEAVLQAIRTQVREAKGVATCVGFGPRFQHSTGQAYKGGPNSGVFLQITADDARDLPVPGQSYSFGVVKAAQARGDLEVLVERRRRALRVHLGPDVDAGLAVLASAIGHALK
jgi:transaldolase/glucose-6-phosphate isomerase